MLSGNQTIAAYQPTPRDTYNRDSKTDEEIHRLREENRQLKAAQRNSNFQTGRNAPGLDGNRTSPGNNTELSRALEEIRRMQARMDGFMRTYASRSSRQDQPRVRTRDGRPICDICGKIGHVRQQCFHRFQQNSSYCQQQTISKRFMTEDESRISVFEQEAPSRNHQSSDQNKQTEQAEQVEQYARRSQPILSTPVSTEVPTISSIDAISKQHAEAASAKALQANGNQELVIRIEICTTNKPIDMKDTPVMPTLTDENLAHENLASPENTNTKFENNPVAKEKVHHDTAQIKCSLKPAGTLDPIQNQTRKEKERETAKQRNSASLPFKREQRNAFVTAEILGCPVDLLVDSGACISVMDAKFLREAFPKGASPIMVPSTYSRVDTVSGEKLPTVGKIEVSLLFNGKEFPCQFHVIENMSTNAVLGRDFLLTNGAIINFANGKLKLDNI